MDLGQPGVFSLAFSAVLSITDCSCVGSPGHFPVLHPLLVSLLMNCCCGWTGSVLALTISCGGFLPLSHHQNPSGADRSHVGAGVVPLLAVCVVDAGTLPGLTDLHQGYLWCPCGFLRHSAFRSNPASSQEGFILFQQNGETSMRASGCLSHGLTPNYTCVLP